MRNLYTYIKFSLFFYSFTFLTTNFNIASINLYSFCATSDNEEDLLKKNPYEGGVDLNDMWTPENIKLSFQQMTAEEEQYVFKGMSDGFIDIMKDLKLGKINFEEFQEFQEFINAYYPSFWGKYFNSAFMEFFKNTIEFEQKYLIYFGLFLLICIIILLMFYETFFFKLFIIFEILLITLLIFFVLLSLQKFMPEFSQLFLIIILGLGAIEIIMALTLLLTSIKIQSSIFELDFKKKL